ncbi:S-layer homology domain-containing protein [Proteiniborus sp. DW1]|uniref:S-layer homology domain-containing protein n=1 Tax=Proteiniborus sp. DW1 TaxID=1889883 RepID=UPI000941D915|nr:S-layer homology domain-containing protein [Proteiniborus sp. DW1]
MNRKVFGLKKGQILVVIVCFFMITMLSDSEAISYGVDFYRAYNENDIKTDANIVDTKEIINKIELEQVELVPEVLVSHAGGRVKGKSYTNSKESIDKSYENGYRFIELDFQWTADGNLALIHDWDGYVNTAFGVESKMYSTEEFKSFNMIEGLTQMILDDLAEWLHVHNDVYIVTDIKYDNVKALGYIKDRYPDLVAQFIPQIYRIEQFVPVKELGYKNIILTLYASNYSDDELIDFVKAHRVFAITMPIARAKTELPRKLKEESVFVYAHTINSQELRQELELCGVDGFYTDDILPLSWGIDQVEKAREYNLVTDSIIANLHQYLTREEVCELLVNLYEAMSDNKAELPDFNIFTDTDNPEVLKANALGLVNGVNETQFLPKANITREEMATMIYRTLEKLDESLIEDRSHIYFADVIEISNWALEPISFLSDHNILIGVGSNRVAPKDNVTREQGIILVKRVYEKFKLDLDNHNL